MAQPTLQIHSVSFCRLRKGADGKKYLNGNHCLIIFAFGRWTNVSLLKWTKMGLELDINLSKETVILISLREARRPY